MLIYTNQHQSLWLDMLIFQGFLALPLTGESFNQRFPKETRMKAPPRQEESTPLYSSAIGIRYVVTEYGASVAVIPPCSVLAAGSSSQCSPDAIPPLVRIT